MSTQKERPLGGSCQTFYFFLLHLIKRLGEDQPCQIKNGRDGLARTEQGCPNQGLLGLLGNCRFIEISLEWVQVRVRPSCWQTLVKVMQKSPANRQFSELGNSMWGLQASFCRGAVKNFLFLQAGLKCILHFCYTWLLHRYVLELKFFKKFYKKSFFVRQQFGAPGTRSVLSQPNKVKCSTNPKLHSFFNWVSISAFFFFFFLWRSNFILADFRSNKSSCVHSILWPDWGS